MTTRYEHELDIKPIVAGHQCLSVFVFCAVVGERLSGRGRELPLPARKYSRANV